MPLGPQAQTTEELLSAHTMDEDPELTRLIRAERIRMLLAPTTPVALVSAGVAVGLGWAIASQTARPMAWAWAGMCVLVSMMRLAHRQAYRRARSRDDPRWLYGLTAVCAVQGVIWGLAGVFFPQDMVTASIVAAALIGACAAGTFTLQAHFLPNLTANVPMLLPIGVTLLLRRDAYGMFGGLGVLGLLGLMLFESRRAERRISELLWLRFTTDRIASERATALQQAQRQSAIRDQFLAKMSHEMRTPLHGILGLARVTRERLPARPAALAESRHHIELIERAGEHLLHIINDVLDFSRIEAGKLHIEPAPFEVRALIEEVMGLLRLGAHEKGLALMSAIELPTPCWVLGDAARVRQMLHNLLGNAIKFTLQGEVRLRVSRLPGTQDAMRFVVQDTGRGIPADHMALIFEAFHQVEGGIGQRQKGTGLGLTITREIAKAMGGDVHCNSLSGSGSVFTLSVLLPPTLAASAPAAVWQASGLAQPKPAPEPTPAGLAVSDAGHALLVEDNAVNAVVAEATLHRLGLQVTRVETGQAALALLRHHPHAFDIVLMDLQMPGMDGLQTCRLLRHWEQDQGLPAVPVVALTANAQHGDRTQCLAAGMNDHLSKPFRAEELQQVLQRHLPERASANA